MRIRSLEIRNWACIESLSLANFTDGIVVLHGPNRTGKSSVAEALRCALFDLDHNTTSQRLGAAIPRRSQGVPQVTVEFECAGARHRLTKAFSRNREGFARLEQLGPGGWVLLADGRNANARTRELLGVEKSNSGLFQMLWLSQGDIRLPERPDPILTKSLESVLGSLITGHDLDFKTRLDRACERWFTPTMQEKRTSPLKTLEAKLAEERQKSAEIEKQWTDAETALRQYEEALARQPDLRSDLAKVERELESAALERQQIRERLAGYEVARKNVEHCQRLYEQAEGDLRDHDETAREEQAARSERDDLTLALRHAESACVQSDGELDAVRRNAGLAGQKLGDHRKAGPALQARQRLVAIRATQSNLVEKISAVEGLEKERGALEDQMASLPVLSETQIAEIRQRRDRIASLRAQLEAEEIHVAIEVTERVEIAVQKDGEAPLTANPPVGLPQNFVVRQNGEFRIGTQAIVRVSRGREARDLELKAAELADLERTQAQSFTAARLEPDDPHAVEHLAARRFQHEERLKQLKALRERIVQAAPDGLASLRARLSAQQAELADVYSAHPELQAWEPDQSEVDRLRGDLEREEQGLLQAVQEANERIARWESESRRNAETVQDLRSRLAVQDARVNGLSERLSRKERATLVRGMAEAAARYADAQRSLEASTPTEAERAIEARYEAVRAAQAQRAERLRQNETVVAELRGKLTGTEGLHQRRIQADQRVNDLERELKRERLHADAHKHLKVMFDTVRQEQVRRTVGPINDRVMQWARHLGIGEYGSLAFDDRLLPAGLTPTHLPGADAVAMESESYGTLEQLSLLIRLAVGGLLAEKEPAVAILDDPLTHTDPGKHRKMLDILAVAAQGSPGGPHPAGPLQLIVLTCHADRFDHLQGAQHIDLAQRIRRGG